MEFNPDNHIIKLCVHGIDMEGKGNPEEAGRIFMLAWDEATNDFEKYIAAYFVARQQKNVPEKIKWLETSLQYALKINNDSVKAAFPDLYFKIAKCYEESGDHGSAKENYDLAISSRDILTDKGPFYHGTRADLKIGDFLTAGNISNYNPGIVMNHNYFTALLNGAGLAAALARGEGRERIYIVEPTGSFEHDPNVTDKKFPGNPTRSYRTMSPLKIVGEVTHWVRKTPAELQQWREKLASSKGDIIN